MNLKNKLLIIRTIESSILSLIMCWPLSYSLLYEIMIYPPKAVSIIFPKFEQKLIVESHFIPPINFVH
jgi:hypothetical protein